MPPCLLAALTMRDINSWHDFPFNLCVTRVTQAVSTSENTHHITLARTDFYDSQRERASVTHTCLSARMTSSGAHLSHSARARPFELST
jgi:hypothetical protein